MNRVRSDPMLVNLVRGTASFILAVVAGLVATLGLWYWSTAGEMLGLFHPEVLVWVVGHFLLAAAVFLTAGVIAPGTDLVWRASGSAKGGP